MIKKIVATFAAAAILTNCVAFADENQSETFGLNIGIMSQEEINSVNQKFTKLDLRKFMNRDIKDEVAGDRKGGWSDQGPNDLSMFDKFGDQKMLGVPFSFVDPEKNNGNGVIALRGRADTSVPVGVDIPVNQITAGAYIIHAAPWCIGKCGTYSWVYEDGTKRSIDILANIHIRDYWGKKDLEYLRTAWSVNWTSGNRSLNMLALNNPEPQKKVKYLRLEATGSGPYIMVMAVTLTDKGPYLTPFETSAQKTLSTFGWFENVERDEEKVSGTALDFSNYLDAPAGKHGKLLTNGENLRFNDGTKAKFWGADITGTAAMPEKSEADEAALRLSHLGVNLVRFSKFDEAILGNGDISSAPDKTEMDKMAYFIAKLKEKGIYSYISFSSERKLREGDKIENYERFKSGYGIDVYFDDEILNLQKQFITAFMNYKNPYTGAVLKDDAAVCFAELTGENSIYDYFVSTASQDIFNNNIQYNKAKKKFNEFLKNKYKTTDSLKKAWNSVYDRNDYENLEEMSVELKANLKNVLVSEKYKKDLNEFFESRIEAVFNTLKECFEGSHAIVTVNTNVPNKVNLCDTAANTKTDFVTRAFYSSAPRGRSETVSVGALYDKFEPITKSADNIIKDFALNAPSGKPYLACWAAATPNIYFSEASIMMAAFSAQKNWSAVQHAFAVGSFSEKDFIYDYYSMYNNPVRLAVTPAAAAIYYTTEEMKSTSQSVNKGGLINKQEGIGNVSAKKLFTENNRFNFEGNSDAKLDGTDKKLLTTDNIYWDSQNGFFAFKNQYAEAATGLTGGENKVLENFSIKAENQALTIVLNALGGKTLKDAEIYLLTAAHGNQNISASVDTGRKEITSIGEAPIVIEPINAEVTLKIKDSVTVYPLTMSGERLNAISVTKTPNGFSSFKIGSDYKTLYYEIVKN